MIRTSEGISVVTALVDESQIVERTAPELLSIAKDEFKKRAVRLWERL